MVFLFIIRFVVILVLIGVGFGTFMYMAQDVTKHSKLRVVRKVTLGGKEFFDVQKRVLGLWINASDFMGLYSTYLSYSERNDALEYVSQHNAAKIDRKMSVVVKVEPVTNAEANDILVEILSLDVAGKHDEARKKLYGSMYDLMVEEKYHICNVYINYFLSHNFSMEMMIALARITKPIKKRVNNRGFLVDSIRKMMVQGNHSDVEIENVCSHIA